MVQIQFRPAGTTIDVPRGTLLIDAVRRAGLPIASPCGDDLICGRCGVRVLSGQVSREAPVERNLEARVAQVTANASSGHMTSSIREAEQSHYEVCCKCNKKSKQSIQTCR